MAASISGAMCLRLALQALLTPSPLSRPKKALLHADKEFPVSNNRRLFSASSVSAARSGAARPTTETITA
jgi:hypothetical protein